MNTSRLPQQPQKAPKAKADSTNALIIDAAEQLFAEKNYEATTLREIAKIVGIKEPSIYAHFANKEAIYEAVIDRALEPFYNEIYTWNHSQMTLKDISQIPRKLLELHAQHPYSAQILHKELCNIAERINPKVLQWIERFNDQSQQFMSELPENRQKTINRNKVVTNYLALTNMILGVFSSQGLQMKLLGKDYRDSELFEEHVKVITKIFKSLVF